jgi:hypothetical protein
VIATVEATVRDEATCTPLVVPPLPLCTGVAVSARPGQSGKSRSEDR